MDSRFSGTKESTYTVGKLLAVGACSRVYNCIENDKLVIKKVEIGPNPSRDTKKIVQEICNEIEQLTRLNHRRVVHYVDSHMSGTEFCLVLEKMSAGSLSQYLEKHGALDEELCRKCTIQILDGLTYLHKEKIIHRDIKGSHILLNESGEIKLSGFHVAKLMECSTKGAGDSTSSVGSVHWMAPEVVRAEPYGRKCDIWSLGCTLVEMLTAKPPWPDSDQFQVMYNTGQGSQPKYTPPEGLSEAALDFIELCFKTDPQERPSAAELMQHRFVMVSGGETGEIESPMDNKVPKLEIEDEDSITRAMQHVVTLGHSIGGLNIRHYSCHRTELEVIAAVDEEIQA